MKKLFLTGPFFVYLGIAAQNFGLVLFGILVPLRLFYWNNLKAMKRFRILGILLLTAWGLWPLCNLIAAGLLQRKTLFHPPFDLQGPLSISSNADLVGNWLSSQLPSSVGVSGLILFLASFYRSPKENLGGSLKYTPDGSQSSALHIESLSESTLTNDKTLLNAGETNSFLGEKAYSAHHAVYNGSEENNQLEDKQDSQRTIESWIKILFYSCLIFGAYFTIQHVTGFDFRKSQSYLPNMQFPGGTYRIQGFSGHPLTIAGISLCLVGFSSWMIGFFIGKSKELLGYTAGILLLNLFFLYASGGRTAFFIALLWLGLIGNYLASKLVKPRTLILSWVAITLLLFLVLTMSGIGERYLEAFQMNESGKLPNRVVFWKVHWQMFLDSPWFGQGYGHLSKGLRLLYYDAMGYRDFEERFNAHNMILETLSNLGIIGTMTLCGIGYKLWRIGGEIAQSDPLTKNIGIGLLVATGLNFLHGFTQNVFYDSGVMVVYMNLFWLFIWSGLSMKNKKTRRNFLPN